MLHAMNNLEAPNDRIDVRVRLEPLADGRLVSLPVTTLTLPKRANREFCYIHLDAVNGKAGLVATLSQKPISEISRIIAAWGTEPNNAENIRQVQTDRIVRFRGSYTFDPETGEVSDEASPHHPGGFVDNVWRVKPAAGAWPSGLCQAVRFRGEAYRIGASTEVGHCQANFAAIQVEEGEQGLPTMGFVTQVKGTGEYVSLDDMRLPILPGSDWYAVMAGADSRGYFLPTGYELIPT